MLHVQRLQLELIRSHLRFLVPRIARHDKRLAEQLRNAANSSGLNTDEGLMALVSCVRSSYAYCTALDAPGFVARHSRSTLDPRRSSRLARNADDRTLCIGTSDTGH
jgi:superfamily II DNA or RNA helicase